MNSHRSIGSWCAGVALVGLLVGSTVPVPSAAAAPSAKAAAASSADDPVNRVVAISVDGLNPKAITALGRSGAPNFYRLMREGATTLNARTAREQTRTLPNHTGMLTGRRIDDRRGGHGVTFNSDTGTTVHRAAGEYVSSVFDVVHDRGGSTALFTAKKKFALYQRTWNTKGATDKVGVNNGRAKIDRFTVDTDNARLVGKVTADLRQSPRTFTFVHLSLPDETGHDRGQHSLLQRARLRSVRTLLTRRQEPFNVKEHALAPIVNLARWAAVSSGSSALSTIDRLRATAGSVMLPAAEASTLIEIFEVLQRLRLRYQFAQLDAGEKPTDDVAIERLSPIDRSVIGQAVREISAVQRRAANLSASAPTDAWLQAPG